MRPCDRCKRQSEVLFPFRGAAYIMYKKRRIEAPALCSKCLRIEMAKARPKKQRRAGQAAATLWGTCPKCGSTALLGYKQNPNRGKCSSFKCHITFRVA